MISTKCNVGFTIMKTSKPNVQEGGKLSMNIL